MSWILIAMAAIGATVIAHYADRNPAWGYLWFGLNAIVCAVVAVISVVQREWGWAVWMSVCAVAHGWWCWRCRKRRMRERAGAMVGAKSWARIQALVTRQRAAQRRTRPVLRPVPSGAS